MFQIATRCNECGALVGFPIGDISHQRQNTLQYGRGFYIHYCDEHKYLEGKNHETK